MKYIIIFIIILINFDIFCQKIKMGDAKELGINFLKYKTGNKFIDSSHVKVEEKNENDTTFFYEVYVYNEASVLISSNYLAGPYLAYTTEGRFNINDKKEDEINFWLEMYKDIIRYVNKHNGDSTFFQKEINLTNKSTKGYFYLIKSKWHQGCPYNKYINDNDMGISCTNCHKCYAGCVSIAVAQIMRYWRYPSYFDWCNMPATLTGNSSLEEVNATATLIADIGKVLNIDYCSANTCSSSGSDQKVKQKLPLVYGYHSSIDIKRKFYYSQDNWKKIIREQLDDGQPVYYSGCKNEFFTGEGLELCGGHAFICDGYDYDDNNFFHFNMGWGGGGDGFYYMFDDDGDTLLLYKRRQQAIINIKPSESYSCNMNLIVKEQYQHSLMKQLLYYNPIAGIITTSTEDPPHIENAENVIYRAYDEIILNDGFIVNEGGEFIAEIINCPLNCILTKVSKNNDKDENEKDYIEENNEDRCKVYPNPTSEFVFIKWKEHKNIKVLIYNIAGKNIIQSNFCEEIKIDLSYLKKGIYIIQCIDEKEIITKKIIIN